MPKGDKYRELTKYLSNSRKKQITITFHELETLCGLPASAYRWPACWSNSSDTSLSYGWLLADYIVDAFDIIKQTVVFSHNPEMSKQYLNRPVQRAQNRNNYEKYCRTHAAPAELVDTLPLILSAKHFYQSLLIDPNSRYRSWEHCYMAFQRHFEPLSPDILDYLSLHLAWYLASWGMLRGSAFLLQKDYKIHLPAVQILTAPQWASLRDLSRRELMDGSFADTTMELATALRQVYQDSASETPSDTLLTKIILGTIGCTPAYDRYFRWAVKETRAASSNFTTQSLKELGRFYAIHWEKLEYQRLQYSREGLDYPPMKLLDMCFFQYGLEHQEGT